MKQKSFGVCPYRIKDGTVYILMNKTNSKSDWNFFKGKMEEKENVYECAIREFYEEAGVKVKKKHLEDFFIQQNKRKDIGVFLVDWSLYNKPFKFCKKEIKQAKWIDIFKFKDLEVSKNQRQIFNSILTFFLSKEYWIKNVIIS